MPAVHEYYCTKCGTRVKDGDIRCPKCKSLLAADGAVKIKKIQVSEARLKLFEDIYKDNFKLFSELTEKEKEKFKQHNIQKKFPIWLCIILHFITLGIFTLIYFGIKQGKLPQVNEDDPSTGQAIGYSFIPFYNLYWSFIYWLRLTDRINFQYKLRVKEMPINRTFVKTTLILGVIPFIWFIEIFILKPIVVGIVQSASNGLVNKKS